MTLIERELKNAYIGQYIFVTGVTLNTSSITFSSVGATSQLTATVAPANAENKSVTWTSSNTSVATVSNTGLVTCTGYGSATITVTTVEGGFTATASVSVTRTVDFLLVAGGGGGGSTSEYASGGGGGGGAGGYWYATNCALSSGSYCIVIGAGGMCGWGNRYNICEACKGGDSCFGTRVVYGGGRGGGYPSESQAVGGNGGSGGGGSYDKSGGSYCNYTYGRAGGCGKYSGGYYSGGGGGGAAGAGGNGNADTRYGGNAGTGCSNSITGTTQYYSYGGYGSGYCGNGTAGCNGCGKGGNASKRGGVAGGGTAGIFVIRYKCGAYTMTGGCKYLCNGYCIHCFTSNGTLCVS